jgi:prepilin-type N-terminal cleavage/methylation domain-containing protein
LRKSYHLFFYKDLTQTEIGKKLGLSQRKVSRLVASAIKKLSGSGKDDRGFTLPELMIVIVLLGILAAIAMPSWWGVVESREVESAKNQVVADLRLAHTRSANRLAETRFEVTAADRYTVTTSGDPVSRTLDGATLDPAAVALAFRSNGEVRNPDGSELANPAELSIKNSSDETIYVLKINTQTSRVEIASS